jgi:hypothetical protein
VLGEPDGAAGDAAPGIEHAVARADGGDVGQHAVRVEQRVRMRAPLLIVIAEMDRVIFAVEPHPPVVEPRTIVIRDDGPQLLVVLPLIPR